MKDIILTYSCPFCGNITQIRVCEDDYNKYINGKLVQHCFPYLTATEREVIISGICPTCQDLIFKEV